MTQTEFHHAKPVYEHLARLDRGHLGRADLRRPADERAATTSRFLEERSGARISAIGVGPDRDQTVVLHDLLD